MCEVLPVRTALSYPHIQPAPPDDPRPNPAGGMVYVDPRKHTESEEIQAVVTNLACWLPANQEKTEAVL